MSGPWFFCTKIDFTQVPVNEHAAFIGRVFRYQDVVVTDIPMENALEISTFVGYKTHVNVWQM